ncbi:MAG: phosphatidate cytidylyltransferase [Desulfobacterales bacterium]|nr:MAG: phosphatidate cytidylyltransferase [Desulfobacterales bacterium]
MEIKVLSAIGLFFLIAVLFILLGGIFIKNRATIRDLWILYFTETIVVGLMLFPAYLGQIPFFVMVSLIGIKSQHEIFKHVLLKCPHVFKYTGYAACPVICASALFQNQASMFQVLLIVACFLLVVDIGIYTRQNRFDEMGKIVLITIFPCIFLAFLVLLRKLPNGFNLVVFLYGVSEVNDAFALILGTMFGKKKIFPKLSPNKTYVGTFGGLCAAVLFGVLFNHFVVAFPLRYAFAGIFIVITTTILGDLVTSKVKRNLNIKDFGRFLPKHGGILDIYDAVIFSAPLFYWYAESFFCK